MLNVDQKITIVGLKNSGKSYRSISKDLGISRNTIKKVIKNYNKNPHSIYTNNLIEHSDASTIPYKDFISEYLKKWPHITAMRIWEKLKEEKNYPYQYDTIRRYISKIKTDTSLHAIFDTSAPGEIAQVDFGYVGLIKDPNTSKMRKAYVFCMRLVYSRYDYFEVVFSQKVSDFIKCHINAFNYFGGVPNRVKIDNLKSAVIKANFYEPIYQADYLELSKHYSFNAEACRVYKPKDKAQVENGIKYVKRSFFDGRDFKNIYDCNERLLNWMHTKSQRIHGTTREKPIDLFNKYEKPALTNLPEEPYEIVDWAERRLYSDSYLRINKGLYSAPHSYVGETLFIKVTSRMVYIYNQKFELLCVHLKSDEIGKKTKKREHFPDWINDVTDDVDRYYFKQATKHGQIIHNYCEKIFEHHKFGANRMIKGLLNLIKTHSKEKIENACLRASSYDCYNYRTIKNIVENKYIGDNEVFDVEAVVNNQETKDYAIDLKKYDLLYH